MPWEHCPFAQIKIDVSAHAQIFTAQRYTFRTKALKEVFIPVYCASETVWT